MLVSIFFTTMFLTVNHLYSIVASPLVSEDDVVASDSHNLTHAPTKREYLPPGMLCEPGEIWYARNCFGEELDKVWVDFCWDTVHGRLKERFGICPGDSICMNAWGPPNPVQPATTIMCFLRPDQEIDNPKTIGQPPPPGQCGVYIVTKSYSLLPAQHVVSVPITKTITKASVAAYLGGTYLISQWLTVT